MLETLWSYYHRFCKVTDIARVQRPDGESAHFSMIAQGKSVEGYAMRFQICTLVGVVTSQAAPRDIVNKADGIVFVADLAEGREEENLRCYETLKRNLSSQRIDPQKVPLVFQYNTKSGGDTGAAMKINAALNDRSPMAPMHFSSSDRFAEVTRMTFESLRDLLFLRNLESMRIQRIPSLVV